MSTGTDEHGLKIQQKAKENNIDILKFCDDNSQKFKDLFNKANIKYDDFIRTTESRHKKFAQDFWEKLEKKNEINKSKKLN
jgi:methionyl-tRNA synthetase